MCAEIHPVVVRTEVLILQHPQEPDKDLGTARLLHLALPNSSLKIGLSWPNLQKVTGRPVNPKEWGVLYLGSKVKQTFEKSMQDRISYLDGKGDPLSNEVPLRGLVVLDGTWSQAKTLWWRNPWLLKLQRLVLIPAQRSLYGSLRKEPRRECVSTLEAVGAVLSVIERNSEIKTQLNKILEKLLSRF